MSEEGWQKTAREQFEIDNFLPDLSRKTHFAKFLEVKIVF